MTDRLIIDAMFAAGIPARYHGQACTFAGMKVPQAEALRAWCHADALRWAAEGGTVQVTGSEDNDGVDCVGLIARALLLQGRSCLLIALPKLLHLVAERRYDIFTEHKVLLVLGFTGTHWKRPMEDAVGLSAEWFLRGWLDAGCALLTHGEQPLAESPSWWPKSLRNSILRQSRKEWVL